MKNKLTLTAITIKIPGADKKVSEKAVRKIDKLVKEISKITGEDSMLQSSISRMTKPQP